MSLSAFLLSLSCITAKASAHTWVEQLNRISPNGTLLDPPGFPPKWFGRGEGFRDDLFTNLLSSNNYSLCVKQPLGEQMEGFPLLEAASGDLIALRYQENGHVTLPDTNKPLNRGTIFVYGTSSPRATDTLFDVYKKWTADGKGGDGRGKLLATRNYDDGQCYQVNNGQISAERQRQFHKIAATPQGADLWCQADVRLPEDLIEGSLYSVYFIWTWPTLTPDAARASVTGRYGDFPPDGSPSQAQYLTAEEVVKSEIYSSCATVRISDSLTSSSEQAAFITDQDVNRISIKQQLENPFLVAGN
ncbi:hypothetical protein LX32DRAFT_712633 [Colletotrichum zoysiae]|uniref:DUF7492 domain-containing protein n=1 Tax=Colletotrichum zoysiae TaxID=1216348 RepID=A0AAD9H568_9PEZI|nr:hypothetical protein LX32DRAFT_712633 [Colletotrichum zoysiae]